MAEEKNQIEVRSKLNKAIALVDAQLLRLEEIKTSSYQTHGEFKWDPGANYVSCQIQKITDIHELISIHSSIRTKKGDYEASAKMMHLDSFPSYLWQNIPAEKWLFDIELRIKIVNRHLVEKELNKKKAILEKHLSEDDKLERTLKSLGFE
jgi:hypothetical protein